MLANTRRLVCVGRNYWWGHTTLEDNEKAIAKEKSKNIIHWTPDPDKVSTPTSASDILRKDAFGYLPIRIEEEGRVLVDTTFEKFNFVDYFSFVNRSFAPYFTNPVYFMEQYERKKYLCLLSQQKFSQERTMLLGPDLAAAYFLCQRKCRVRFRGHETWTEFSKSGKLQIPDAYEKGWYIEAIDASMSNLIYEGFQNLRNLMFLKDLDLSYCPNIDTWCMDRISSEYQDSLETLNLSGCLGLNWNSLECIWRLKRLKLLVLKDMDHVKDIKLICLMLLDVLPDLVIEGVDYIQSELLMGTEHEHLLLDVEQHLMLIQQK